MCCGHANSGLYLFFLKIVQLFLFLGAMAPVVNSGEKEWAHLSCCLVYGEVEISEDRTSIDLQNCDIRRKKKWV